MKHCYIASVNEGLSCKDCCAHINILTYLLSFILVWRRHCDAAAAADIQRCPHSRPLCCQQIVDWHLLGASPCSARASLTITNVSRVRLQFLHSRPSVQQQTTARCRQRPNEINSYNGTLVMDYCDVDVACCRRWMADSRCSMAGNNCSVDNTPMFVGLCVWSVAGDEWRGSAG